MTRGALAPLDETAFEALMRPLEPFEAEPELAIAVSGGRDSMALALLADAWARARGGKAGVPDSVLRFRRLLMFA